MNMEWTASMDEYEKLVIRMNTPRVVIDNAACPVATVIKVDSARKRGVLLEAVQILTDLELHISKAYISSDGRWFMDVFHVTDRHGRKLVNGDLVDGDLVDRIERSLTTIGDASRLSGGGSDSGEEALTALELTGADRPGLLSEVFAVLTDLQCGVSDARLWTHNGRIASVVFLKDHESGSAISDPLKVHRVKARLRNVLKGDHGGGATATTAVSSTSASHVDRRLHQLMFAICDHEGVDACSSSTTVSVQNWIERGYSIVTVQCRDRPKLLFDVVCTLTDMEYVVFHGTIDTNGDRAHQEFYIRHVDGSPISSEAERHRVIHCLQAAIERRASEGLRLELCSVDRRGFLADVTRVFRENGLSVLRAEVTAATNNDQTARNVFYVTDASGYPVDPKTIDAVIELVGAESLRVGEQYRPPLASQKLLDGDSTTSGTAALLYLGSIVKRNLYNLGLIRSCS